jgi:hypothetical protein
MKSKFFKSTFLGASLLSLFLKWRIVMAILTVIGGLGTSNTTWATVIFNNPITATDPSTANPYTAGQTFDANIIVSGIGRGAGITASSAQNRYSASSWNTTSIDTTAYFTFTLTPNSGYVINFTDFIYTGQASGAGPTSFTFRSSVDGFSADIGSPTAIGTTIDLSGAAYQGVSSAIEFRLYGWNASAGTGTFSVNDFTFDGSVVSAVPEPAEWGMISALGLLGICGVSTWRKQCAIKRAILA